MLSVLIPIYNFDVRPLVENLHRQAEKLEAPYEILCMDDASSPSFQRLNRTLDTLSGVVYQELPENTGRARIRNRMAETARYEYLLFMDGDSKVVSEDYLEHYLRYLPNPAVLYGGRCYSQVPPTDPDLSFHWLYGTRREQKPARARALHPHHGFMTNNFVISKSIFEQVKFDEQITQYGHEDTLFGLQLQQKDIDIVHLDNPLEHIGLEKNDHFLEKSLLAVENLAFLMKRHPDLETRLTRAFYTLQKYQLAGLVNSLLKIFQSHFTRNLKGKRPVLLLFDLIKLGYLLEINRKQEN